MAEDLSFSLEYPVSPLRPTSSGRRRPTALDDSNRSTITVNQDMNCTMQNSFKFLCYESPKASQQRNQGRDLSAEVATKTKRSPRALASLRCYAMDMENPQRSTLTDLEAFLMTPPGRREPSRIGLGGFMSHSMGSVIDRSTPFTSHSSTVRRPFSSGPNDRDTWMKIHSRRKRMYNCIKPSSTSLRSLPRDLEIQMAEAGDEVHEQTITQVDAGQEENTDSSEIVIGAVTDSFARIDFPGAPLPDTD